MSAIYALACPLTNAVRYVGLTTRTPERRLIEHLWPSARRRGHTPVYGWLLSLSGPPLLIVLEVDPPDLPEAERRWIAMYRESGADLLNAVGGGGGLRKELS